MLFSNSILGPDAVFHQGDGDALPKFPMTHSQALKLASAVMVIMNSYGANASEILKLNSRSEIVWDIPPRYVDDVGAAIAMPAWPKKPTAAVVQDTFFLAKDRAFREGAIAAIGLLTPMGRTFAANELAITPTTEGGQLAQDLFCAEFALCCVRYPGAMVINGENFVNRIVVPGGGTLAIGVRGRYDVPLNSIVADRLYRPRGMIIYDSIDIIDKCYLWSRMHATSQDLKDLHRGLATLKMVDSHKLTLDIEEMVYRLGHGYMKEEPKTQLEKLYTDENLNDLRDIWVTSDDPETGFTALFRALVPTYLDYNEFETMFNVVPSKWEDHESFLKVDNGIEKFTKFFLNKQHRINNGQRLGVRG